MTVATTAEDGANPVLRVSSEDRFDYALFERDKDREPGPHMLNRSFSGTY